MLEVDENSLMQYLESLSRTNQFFKFKHLRDINLNAIPEK